MPQGDFSPIFSKFFLLLCGRLFQKKHIGVIIDTNCNAWVILMAKTCDLHTHSVFSDGTFTPAELIDASIEAGLSAVALTDHNTVSGLSDFLKAGYDNPIEVVPGTEFTT